MVIDTVDVLLNVQLATLKTMSIWTEAEHWSECVSNVIQHVKNVLKTKESRRLTATIDVVANYAPMDIFKLTLDWTKFNVWSDARKGIIQPMTIERVLKYKLY